MGRGGNGNLVKARARKRYLEAIKPRVPKPRRRKHPFYKRKNEVLAAIPGTRGIWSELARRMGCTLGTIQRALEQEGWEDVREAFLQEGLVVLGKVKNRLFDVAIHSTSDQASTNAGIRILEHLDPEFQPKSKVIHEGGSKPIQVQQIGFQIVADVLKLGVEERLKLLDALDAKELECEDD